VLIPNRERVLVELLREIAAERGIEMLTFSWDWIILLRKGGLSRHVYGYNFDLNSAAAQMIAGDKTAVSDLLDFHGVPHVEHRLFLHPRLAGYVSADGNWEAMRAYAERCGWDVVCKPKDGTGGHNVFRARGAAELERAVHKLLADDYAVSLSPFYPIEQEYRFIMLGGRCELAYAKQRPAVRGDGRSTLAELLAAALRSGTLPAEAAARALRDHAEQAGQVLPAGQSVDVNWKHNLGQGSRPRDIADAKLRRCLVDLARAAAEALRLTFASVDIIATGGRHLVLEVNSGIMMETYARTAAEGRLAAKAVYAAAVERMFAAP